VKHFHTPPLFLYRRAKSHRESRRIPSIKHFHLRHGDGLGEFWTSTILGRTFRRDGTELHKLDLNIDNKTGMIIPVLENSKYDRCSARNLIFILHLTETCHIICGHYEDCLDALERRIDSKVISCVQFRSQDRSVLICMIYRGAGRLVTI
jgi:hypothetical protein